MYKKCRRVLAVMFALVLVVSCAAGCGQTKQNKKVVFKVGDQEVSLNEVWFYCKSVQEYYEQYYASMFSSPKAWTGAYPIEKEDGSKEDSTLEDVAKRSAIKQIHQVKVAAAKADEMNLQISDSEKKEITSQAKSFMSQVTEEEQKKTGITQDLAEKVFTDSLKVQKLKEKLAKDEGIEISDEEAQTSKIYFVHFPTSDYGSDGNVVEKDKDEKKEAKEKAQDLLKRAQAGEELSALASEYGVSSTSGEVNVNADSNIPKGVTEALKDLKDGELYKEVIKESDGYYIVQMKAVVDEQATADKKENLLEKKEQELLSKKFEEWTKKASLNYDKDVNWKLMKEIDFVKESSITTQQAQTTQKQEDVTETSTQPQTTTETKQSEETMAAN